MYDSQTTHRCSPVHGKRYAAKGIFVHRIPEVRREQLKYAECVYKYTKLGRVVVPCTSGVQLPDRSRMFTRPWQTIYRERHFRTPAIWICTAPRSQTRTSQLGCVCTSYKKLGGQVVPCIPGVRLPDRSRMFTRWRRTICSERHFHTSPVRICTDLRSRT